MPTKIRLQRRGKKHNAFYHIVVADGRAPRDGRFIESIGTYNPLTIPATINIDDAKATKWLDCGAIPSDTVKAILSYTGVLYQRHLSKGVKKGAMTEEQALAKFNAWKEEKESKISKKISEKTKSKAEIKKQRLEAEKLVNEQREKEIQAKLAKRSEKESKVAEEEEAKHKAEIVGEEVEAPVAEETSTETTAEVAIETPAEESTPTAEAAE